MGAEADVVRRLTYEGFLKGDVGVLDELLADDFVSHDPPPGMAGDKAAQKQLVAAVAGAFSDIEVVQDDIIETTDGRIVQSWAMIGTHSGEAFGLPPSGQRARVRGIEIFRFENGKIVEHWASVDMSDLVEKAMAGGG